MWQRHYLSAEQLAGFRQYKYTAVDTNPLSVHILQPLWDRIVKIVPLWIAPNLLTVTGFVLILINYFVLSFYTWDYSATGSSPRFIPTWVYVFGAFATFCSYVLDSIDGKHARRTRSSSPLGELLDHGLDSWAVSIIMISLFSICPQGKGKSSVSIYTMYFSLSITLLQFLLSHWEKYNTGVLFLPWVYDIGELVTVGIYLLTATSGMEIWNMPFIFGFYLADALLVSMIVTWYIGDTMANSYLLTVFIYVCCIFVSLPQTLYNIHIAYRKKKLVKNSLYEGLLPLFSPVLLFILLTVWVALSPSNVLARQTKLFFWMAGVMFSNVMCRMIICQMTNTRSEVLHWLMIPFAILVYTAIAGYQGSLEEPILVAFTIFVTAAHVHYGVCVGKQLSKYFNVTIFSVKNVNSERHINATQDYISELQKCRTMQNSEQEREGWMFKAKS